MKYNVPSKDFYNFVTAVSKVINTKITTALRNNFLFTLDGDQLTIKASDTENSLVGRMTVFEAEGSGSVCIDARLLVELLKEMPDQGITFEIDDDTFEVKISYASGSYNTLAINGQEYPVPLREEEANVMAFTAPSEQVIKGMEATLFAVGSDELRPQMMGVLWDVKADGIIFVATDTRKLVKYVNRLAAPGVEGSFILPLKSASVLRTVFAREEEIKVTVTPKRATFESPSFVFDCVLIKGAFPDYNRVIPANNPLVVTVDRLGLLNAVKRVGVFGDGGAGLVKFIITPGKIELNAQDNNMGKSGRETVPCDYEGKAITIGFGGPYIIEIFSSLPSAEVVMKLSDPSRPAVCLPAEESEPSQTIILLMPMNII